MWGRAEAMGGDCESWAEESERQGGLPRENSLDMIDLATVIPDIMVWRVIYSGFCFLNLGLKLGLGVMRVPFASG